MSVGKELVGRKMNDKPWILDAIKRKRAVFRLFFEGMKCVRDWRTIIVLCVFPHRR